MKFSLFKYGTGILYGYAVVLDSVAPDTGPSTGGVDFLLRGNSFQYPTYDDDFLNPILNPAKWNDISSGTGSATTGSGHLQLSTGTTAGSIGGVAMTANHTDMQFESKVNIPPITANPASTVTLYQMQNYVDANNQSNVIVELDSEGVVTLRIQVYLGGALKDEYTTEWTTGVSTFKILRWSTDVYFYANGSLVFKSQQGNTSPALFRFFVDNRADTYNVYNTVVEYIEAKPYAVFGDQVVHDLTVVSDTRARGLTPPSLDVKGQEAAYKGLVDVSIVASAVYTKANAYDYFYLDSLTLLDETQFDLKFSEIDDETVRTPVTSSRGLGGGR